MAVESVSSAPLVGAALSKLSHRAEVLQERGVPPQLSVVTTYAEEPATASYLRMARRLAPLAGVQYERYSSEGDLARAEKNIDALNGVRGSATMVMAPHEPLSSDEAVRERQMQEWRRLVSGIVPHRDADSLASQEYTYPNTALSVLDLGPYLAERSYEDIGPERIAFFGLGKLVNLPAWKLLLRRFSLEVPDPEDKQLNRRGYPLVITRELGNLGELENLGSKADLVFAGAGVAEFILPPHLARPAGSRQNPLAVVDAAYKVDSAGVAHGNLHRAVYDPRLDLRARVTPWDAEHGPHDGVGPRTGTFLIEHAIRAAELDAGILSWEAAQEATAKSFALQHV